LPTRASAQVTGSSGRLGVWWQGNRPAIVEALVVFVGVRVVLSLIASLAVAMVPEQRGQHDVFHRSGNVWLDVWARWDSEYYLDIAAFGYSMRSEHLAFFPLYPALISSLAPVLGHDYVLSGVVVSSLASFVALVYLFKLAAWEFGEEVAGRTILYLAVYPTALFLLAVYTEALFLAVTVAAFYHARRGEWTAAGLVALLAGITRPNGALLLFPLACEAWRQLGGSPRGVRTAFPRPLAGRLLAVAAAPFGLLVWSAYLARLTGDPLAFVHRLDVPPWERVPSPPWATLATAVEYLANSDLAPLSRAVNTTDLVVAVLLIQACVVAWWRLPRAYAVYLTVSTFLLLSTTVARWPLQSLPRYSLVLFPIFLLLGLLGANRHWHRLILIVSAPLLGMYTALFATWYWVF
jgi:hypothetical protein